MAASGAEQEPKRRRIDQSDDDAMRGDTAAEALLDHSEFAQMNQGL
jgi:hypothetical protein